MSSPDLSPPPGPPAWRRHALEAVLESGEPYWAPVSGQSMSPLMGNGAMAEVVPFRPARVRPGDLVVFEADGALICHRVLAVERSRGRLRILEKGDRAWRSSLVAERRVLGLVRRVRDADGTRTLDMRCPAVRSLSLLAAWAGAAAARLAASTEPARRELADVPGLSLLTRIAKLAATAPLWLLRWSLFRAVENRHGGSP